MPMEEANSLKFGMRIDNVFACDSSSLDVYLGNYFSFQAIETYCNALINSNGGILVFGVDPSGRVTLTNIWAIPFKIHPPPPYG